MNNYAIHAEGLTKHYGDTIALDGIDLSVPHGSVLGVLGPNGAGKTTAVRVLATLLRPDSGHATVAGHDILTDPTAVRRSIGLTGQYASVEAADRPGEPRAFRPSPGLHPSLGPGPRGRGGRPTPVTPQTSSRC